MGGLANRAKALEWQERLQRFEASELLVGVRPPQPLLTAGIASRIDLVQPVFEEAFHGQAVESVEGDRVAEAAAAV